MAAVQCKFVVWFSNYVWSRGTGHRFEKPSHVSYINVEHIKFELHQKMTDRTITTYYKWLSLLTLTVSVAGTITLVEGTALEKLGIGILINLQFHLVFQFLSRVPFVIYTLVENDTTWKKKLVPKILKFFSVFIMFGAVIAFIGMLKSVILSHQYSQLIVTMTFLAMFLGGLSLNLKLRQI